MYKRQPKDNIERAIKKAVGSDSDNYVETSFEGYGPGGIAVFTECLTDNNNRTVASVRAAYNKHGGKLGTNGSLSSLFDRKGVFTISKEVTLPDDFELELKMCIRDSRWLPVNHRLMPTNP